METLRISKQRQSQATPKAATSTRNKSKERENNAMVVLDDGGLIVDGGLGLPPHSHDFREYSMAPPIFTSQVLISGMKGLGAEIAKNLVLAGVKSVMLHDEGVVELWDLSGNFIFSEDDVGGSFADICLAKAFEYNDYCRSHQPPIIFIKSEVRDLFGSVFCDFSPEFPVFHDEDPHTGIVTQVRQPNVNFKPLREALRDPGDLFLHDFSKFDHQPLLHLAFQVLDKFIIEFGRFPVAGLENDAQKFISWVIEINKTLSDGKLEAIDQNLLRHFASGARAVLNPMAAMFGGIVGQEVVKACSEKCHPLFQFLYFDSIESVPTQPLHPSDLKPLNSHYDAQISVFGSKIQKNLEDAKVFIVGSGALGCEFLKNLAVMGACGKQGKLIVTDGDVGKCNPSNQFLFRDQNIALGKSSVAASAACLINPSLNLNIEALQIRTISLTEETFHYTFWEDLDVVINAVDNVNDRLYVGRKCLYFQKPLLESGTLGTRCNTQMFIPHLTQNYDASRDAIESNFPGTQLTHFLTILTTAWHGLNMSLRICLRRHWLK
ncbi:hypothetical protein SO802_030641 [Lithocarpus litseifolius]|uniref:E1 ubiquitin-activating enzyme n=1 Tax=Lithocarpus litseifolius TaxID=425828 RepID=A0AAW2BLC3_9ROSI